AAADTVAVSGRPRRGAAGGCLDRRRQTIGIASAPAAAVGRVLAGTDAVARAAARSVLVATRRSYADTPENTVGDLSRLLRGWCGYFDQGPVMETYNLIR